MISGYIFKYLIGWKVAGQFPEIKKSIVIYAPHTSYLDAFIGKLFLTELGIKYKFLSKKELFYFPMNILMNIFGSVPVRGVKSKNAIYHITKMLKNSDELHIIVSPEGTRAKVTKWNYGFYHIAVKANVPIIVGYLDYKKKEIGFKEVISNTTSFEDIRQKIMMHYKDVSAKYPNKFSIEMSKMSNANSLI